MLDALGLLLLADGSLVRDEAGEDEHDEECERRLVQHLAELGHQTVRLGGTERRVATQQVVGALTPEVHLEQNATEQHGNRQRVEHHLEVVLPEGLDEHGGRGDHEQSESDESEHFVFSFSYSKCSAVAEDNT